MRTLLAEAAPEQVLYGSDAPYYTPFGTQAKLFLQLAAAGASEEQRRDVAARGAARLLAGEPCPRAERAARRPSCRCPPARACARTSTSSWPCRSCGSRCPTASGCSRSPARRWARPPTRSAEAALELIALAERTWPLELEHGDRSEILTVSWLTFRLIELADALVMAG